MKRGNDNSQMRAEEVESLNDEESEERGSFQRASADVLATRKIVKIAKRPVGTTLGTPLPSQPKLETSFNLGGVPPSNPFSGFGGLAPITQSVEPFKPTNPFSGFSGLSGTNIGGGNAIGGSNLDSKSKNETVGFSSQASNSFATQLTAASSSKSIATTEASPASGDSEYKRKMVKLNNSFIAWTTRQLSEHPLSIWKDGVKDYIKYSQETSDKYEKGESTDITSVPAAPVKSVSESTETTAKSTAPISFGIGSAPSTTATSTTTSNTSIPPTVASSFTFGAASSITSGAPAGKSFSDTFSFSQPATIKPTTTAPQPFAFGAPANTSTQSTAFSFPVPTPVATVPATFTGFGSSTSTTAFPPLSTSGTAGGFGGFSVPSLTTGGGATTNPFAFGIVSSAPSAAVATTTGDEDGGDDGEGEPILEPEKVLRNENDTDDILLELPCKLYGYHTESKEWKDTGKGSFRITRSADTKKQRMLVRNPIGKLTFNAAFYKGMKIERVKGGLRFSAFVVTEEPTVGGGPAVVPKPELKGFMVKFKEDAIDNALSKLEAGVQSCE